MSYLVPSVRRRLPSSQQIGISSLLYVSTTTVLAERTLTEANHSTFSFPNLKVRREKTGTDQHSGYDADE